PPYRISLSLQSPHPPRTPRSFPTRRSSDLETRRGPARDAFAEARDGQRHERDEQHLPTVHRVEPRVQAGEGEKHRQQKHDGERADRKSTRLNSSHDQISYAVFCLKKKKKKN